MIQRWSIVTVKYDTECDTSNENCNNHLKNNEKINEGTFFSSASDSTISHEFGHILGIDFDPYFTQPYKKPFSRWHNVMGNSLSYSHADWLMFSVIFDSRAFEWQGCKPDFQKYDHMLDAQDFLKKSVESGKHYTKP